ncbi:hypothetical protein [Aestuariibaculum marinum]|uniref:Glycosyltransferase RgtA/B/C/D-like domain-containing protein n=1 Tax=Aestuariibaculum marinum TaxID=2683592 RepID=A0A8J6U5L2_9FLAO|nr:hypothetical protein [Aestuariibaculum marinum]MBD0825055.1 hypothetical protein [Aestuariibaculum marinum]
MNFIINYLSKNKIEICLLVFSIGLTVFSLNFPFYWDNIVQISVPANWYYDTNFSNFYIPDMLATGHPTFVPLYFAIIWKIFSKSLFISHLAMYPFILGLLWQINNLTKMLTNKNNLRILILLFVIADTTLLSQLSLITFDIMLMFFFFLCINAILKGKNILLAFAYLGLVMVSLRGTICGGGILLFYILYNYSYNKKNLKIKNLISFIPGILSIIIFLFSFYLEKGWVIHNTVSNAWKESAEFASPYEILRNSGLFIWRLIDFGRVTIFLVFTFFIFKLIKKRQFENENLKTLFLIITCQCIVFFPIIVIYRNPFGHRYLMPIITTTIILVVIWIDLFKNGKKLVYTLSFLSLIFGHFLLYPEKIAQGWDATTLHWNYYSTRKKMINYIKENNLKVETIGSFFPNSSSFKYTDLDSDEIRFKNVNLEKDSLIVYSNTFNVEDEFIDTLFDKSKWTIVKDFTSNNIYIRLYKKL